MSKVSPRIAHLSTLITKKVYPVFEAITLLKSLQSSKFIESVEAHVALNIDPKQSGQQLRSSLLLPHGTGKNIRVAAFVDPSSTHSALVAGACIAGTEILTQEISRGNINFDILVTTPQLMPLLAKLGKILGPKSLMPSPKSGTVTQNIVEVIREFKKGKLEYRSDKTGIVHLIFGKTSFDSNSLIQNLFAIYDSIEKNKPNGIRGKYFKSIHLCSTMSPSICLDLGSFKTQNLHLN